MAKQAQVRFLMDVALLVGAGLSVYYTLGMLLNHGAGPARSSASKKKTEESLRRLKLENPEADYDLDEYEKAILANAVGPDDIKVGFKDIGGLDPIIDELKEAVLYPLTSPELYAGHGDLLQAPKGVLLYGPPGCGKTMLAKALAGESEANFINIKMSNIMDKWFGESNKIVAAIFSLATKIKPCIIFIDEIDSFLRERSSNDHEITSMLKAEFMTLWDGLTTDGGVMVLGATNRPNDIDKAILRRMPKRFPITLPDASERRKILQLLLKDTKLDPNFNWDILVNRTAGLSGSDLKELCRDAVMKVTREFIRANFKDGKPNADIKIETRPLRTEDFFAESVSVTALPGNIVPEVE